MALAGALVIAMLFMASYVGALHDPLRTPHRLSIAVAGPPRLARLDRAALGSVDRGAAFDVRSEPSSAAARAAVLDHDVYGALTPAHGALTRLLVADASGPDIADRLTAEVARAFRARRRRLAVSHVVRLPAGDPRGLSPFYAALSWVFAGLLGGIVLGLTGGAAAGRRRLAGACSGRSSRLRGGVWSDRLGDPRSRARRAERLLPGPVRLECADGVLGRGAHQWPAGLLRLRRYGDRAAAVPRGQHPVRGWGDRVRALPTPWRIVGPFLPAGAGTTLVRNTVYFGSHHLNMSVVVLGVYALIGVVLTLLAGAGRQSDTERDVAARVADAGAE